MKATGAVWMSLLLSVGLGVLGSEGSMAENSGQESVYAELGKAPAKDQKKPNPLAQDPDAVAAGKVLFEEHCQECHGSGGEGGKKAPTLRAREVQESTPGTLFWILTNGVVRKKMPVWSKLPEPQRWQLVSYLKSLGIGDSAVSKK